MIQELLDTRNITYEVCIRSFIADDRILPLSEDGGKTFKLFTKYELTENQILHAINAWFVAQQTHYERQA